jgi:hypothetical protein
MTMGFVEDRSIILDHFMIAPKMLGISFLRIQIDLKLIVAWDNNALMAALGNRLGIFVVIVFIPRFPLLSLRFPHLLKGFRLLLRSRSVEFRPFFIETITHKYLWLAFKKLEGI